MTQSSGNVRPTRNHLSEFFAVVGVVAAVVLFVAAGAFNAMTTYYTPDSRSAIQRAIVTVLGWSDDGNGILQPGRDICFSLMQFGVPVVCFAVAWRLRRRNSRSDDRDHSSSQ